MLVDGQEAREREAGDDAAVVDWTLNLLAFLRDADFSFGRPSIGLVDTSSSFHPNSSLHTSRIGLSLLSHVGVMSSFCVTLGDASVRREPAQYFDLPFRVDGTDLLP